MSQNNPGTEYHGVIIVDTKVIDQIIATSASTQYANFALLGGNWLTHDIIAVREHADLEHSLMASNQGIIDEKYEAARRGMQMAKRDIVGVVAYQGGGSAMDQEALLGILTKRLAEEGIVPEIVIIARPREMEIRIPPQYELQPRHLRGHLDPLGEYAGMQGQIQ